MARARSDGGPPEISPQLATLADTAPTGDAWLHEIKYDGYRLLCRIDGESVRLISRNGKDWSANFPSVVAAARELPVEDALLDGEVAVVLPSGRTSFQELQNSLGGEPRRGALRFFLFDLPFLNGTDWSASPLHERKARLAALLETVVEGPLHYCDHVVGNGPTFFSHACKLKLEGIISKRAEAPYRPGRNRDWLKVKCLSVEEFVVGGFTEPGGSREGIGALLVGGHDEEGRLRFAGRVGTGFTDAQLKTIGRELSAQETSESPFVDGPEGRAAAGMHWVVPERVAQVAYTEWTNEGLLRHPAFRGFRLDRPAAEVRLPERSDADAREGDAVASSGDDDLVAVRPDAGGGGMRRRTSSARPRSGAAARYVPRSRKRASEPIEIEGVPVSNPEKVMYPAEGITKREVAEHYARVAEYMLPCAAGRPLTLVRCPNGIADCFYQKHIEGSIPDSVKKVPIRENLESTENAEYAVVDSPSGLVALAQLGVIEIHTWGSMQDDLERPDKFTMDFDPDPGVPWIRVAEAALEVRGFLGELGLECFLKTTGGKGLHVVVPVRPRLDWGQIKEFTRKVAETVAFENPGKYTLSMSKEKRKGRILIDYLRNGRGATAIEAWSTRARAGATVAVPIEWEELASGVRSDSFTVRNLPDRLASMPSDPWAGFNDARRPITAKMLRAIGLE